MKKANLVLCSLLALAMMLSACTDQPVEPTDARTLEDIEFPVNTTWNMTAVLVDRQGQVQETTGLTAKVQAWVQDGETYYSLKFLYPENIYNSVFGVIPGADQEQAYYCCAGTATETGEEGKRAPSLCAALDLTKECFIADFDDGRDVYLMAFTDPGADITALWAHFQDFIAQRPEAFPKVG